MGAIIDCGEQLEAFFEASSASHTAYNELMDGNPDESGAFDHATVSFSNIDKSQWKRVKLSDVAEEYAERIDDPSESDYEWYIGSDCIGGFDFRITKRKPASKIHSAQKLFKKGDYLLVRRSLYGSDFRERAPRADFDGICSADILTIREKPGMVADGFLIAVLYSSRLWDFIVRESTGSLTRRIKWNQLKDFEFDLPPYDQQQKIASMLWGMDAAQSAYKHLVEMSDEYVKSQFIEIITPLLEAGKTVHLDDLVEDDRPITYGILKPGTGCPGGVPVIKVKDMRDGVIDQSDLLLTTPELDYQYRRSRLRAGDLLISIRGSVGRMAEVPENLENANITQDTARLSLKPECNKVYVRGVLESEPLQRDMERNIRGVAVKGINIGYLRELGIPICDRSEQDRLALLYQQLDKSKHSAQKALEDLQATQKALIRKYLG